MHKFPKDTNLRRQWVKFVQLKRADFVEPTEHSVICNIHFSPDCYEKSFMVQMGLKKQSPLLSGAVPTIQSPAATNYCETRKRPIQNAAHHGHVYQDNHSTNEQAADWQYIEISYSKNTGN